MAVQISPEPTPEEREAILAALARAGARDDGSAWWAAGLQEAVAEEPTPEL